MMATARDNLRGRAGLVAGLALFAALVAMAWVGFLASDDVTYALGAYGWLEHFPFVGGHGTIRYPITIPMALSFLAFGENEFALVLPSLLYVAGFLILAWKMSRDTAGPLPAFGALVALVTSPLLVIQSSIAGVDVIEMSLLFGSLFLTWQCLEQGPDARRLFAAGALAGLAFLTRETAIFVAVFYGLLFLAGHRFNRFHYLWVAAGFLAVWALELVYLGLMTGDPLYRFNISLHHDATIDRSVDLAGNVIAHPLIDPLLVLLINQEFMALFMLAIPLGGWLCFGPVVEPRLKHLARLLAAFALAWFVCVGAAQTLLPLNPRYFMITSSMACILVGLGIVQLWLSGRRWAAAGAALVLVGGNLVGIYVENRDPVFGEKALASYVAAHPDATVSTDPMTRYRVELPLRWIAASNRVPDAPPAAGSLFYYNPARTDAASFKIAERALPAYRPQPGWTLVREFEPEPSYLCAALEAAGFAGHLPPAIWRKLRYRNPPTALYRVGA